jgi:uncharacterized protein (DUF697 family)
MKFNKLIYVFDKLEMLAARLPESLRKPILEEITPVKKLFLLQRVPRIVLLGQRGTGKAHLINALFGAEVVPLHQEQAQHVAWQDFSNGARGTIRLLDARRPADDDLVEDALSQEAPDLFLFLRSACGIDEELAADLDRCEKVIEFTGKRHATRPGLIGLLVRTDAEIAAEDFEKERHQLHACLLTKPQIGESLVTTLTISSFMRFRLDGTLDAARDERENIDKLAQIITEELPQEARLEMARLSGVRPAQMQIAQVLTKSTTAICAAIGAQPIPLADFPILTSLQVMMVSGIMYISGREISAKLAAEFIAALGANVGAALVLREGSRALLKFLPGWGNAISGAIAGAGTYGIGKAATAYFIEGISLREAKTLLRKKKDREALRD